MRHLPSLTLCLSLVAACGGGPRPAPPSAGPIVDRGDPGALDPDQAGQAGRAGASAAPAGPPVAAKRNVQATFHGVTVDDPYQWLEGDNPEVQAWSDGQDRHARGILDHLPGLATLTAEIRAIETAPLVYFGGFQSAGTRIFAGRKLPDKQQLELVVMDALDAAADAKLVLDPTSGGDPTATFDWFVPSPDGTKLAVSISAGGSEEGSLHILGLDGQDLEPPIPNVQRGTGGGDVAWTADGKGLYYTRYPSPGEKPAAERDFWLQVWFHQLGTPAASDRYELGKDFPQIAEVQLDTDGRDRVLCSVQNGDGGTFQHYVHDRKGWRQITDWADRVVFARLGAGTDLWLVSLLDAPHGKLLRLTGRAALAAAKVVVPEGPDALVSGFHDSVGPVITKDRIYVTYQQGGPNTIRAFTLAGKAAKGPALPAVSANTLLNAPIKGELIVWSESYVLPGAYHRYAPATGKLAPIAAVSPKPPVSLAGWEVRRELVTSKDGTKVPLNIVWKTGAPQDGSAPCVVSGYGGFGISLEPGFAGGAHPLLSRGVCLVIVNLRGGGELGEAWHQAGALTHKQNVFDDFAAALDHLVAEKYTRPERIVIEGGSNGGLLMGAALVQHPDKMKAVIAHVGIYDMLRVELSANGLFNTTEFGTVKDPAQFAALYAYSPYHHVQAGAHYPAVLMTTGANDPRVSPWQSRKMIAALQAAQGGDAPILLRTSASSGHGMGTAMSERIEANAHVAAFALWQLGVAVQ